MSARRLLFVSCGWTTAPLIPRLAPHYTLVVPGQEVADQLSRQGIEALPWNVLAHPKRLAAAATDAERRARAWQARLEAAAGEIFRFAGRRHERAFLAAAVTTLRERLVGQLAVVEFARSLAASGRLAAAVVHEDVTGLVRAFLEGVHTFGVPSVHVPHGVYVRERVVGADVHGEARATMIAAGGPVQRHWFLTHGVSPARVVVTGNPAWDHLCVVDRATYPPLRLPPGPVVTFATSWLGREVPDHVLASRQHRRWTRAALGGVARLRRSWPELRLVVKTHPSATPEDNRRVLELAEEMGVRVDAVIDGPAPPVLGASEALISLPSTVVIEALLLGTPAIVPELCYEGQAVLSVPATAGAVAAALGQVLGGWGKSAEFARRRKAFLALYNGPSDGRAGARVAALVEELAARRSCAPAAPRPSAADLLGEARVLAEEGNRAGAMLLLGGIAEAGAEGGLAAEVAALRGRALAGEGLAMLVRGEHAAAERCLREAAAIDPGADQAWCGLGMLMALRGRPAEARRLLEQALALNPANRDAEAALRALAGAGAAAAEKTGARTP